jgi:signal transduction histidine kinase
MSNSSVLPVSDPEERKPRSRLLYKLTAVFLLLSVAPLILAGFELVRIGNDYIQKESRGVKLAIAQKVASNVASYISDVKNVLQIVHKSSDFLMMDPVNQTEILSNVMNAYPMFSEMAVIDMNGKELASVNRMGNASSAAAAEEAKALSSIRALGEYTGSVAHSAEGYPQLTIGVPIERIPGRPIGVLLGMVNLIDLSSLIKDLTIGEKGYVYILDTKTKQLVAHPEIQTLLHPDQAPEIASASLSPEDAAAGAFEFTDQKKRQFLDTYATVPVPQLSWRVFVQQPTDEAYQAATRMRAEIMTALVLVIGFTLFVSIVVSRVIVKRVTNLQQAMEQVGEGNFDVPVVASSDDEFGMLARKFLWMAGALREKHLNLMSAQRELRKWNTELERRVDERTRALREAQDQLIAQEKLAALGQMASVVGHELRNPLAVMNNSVYFLKTKLQMVSGAGEIDPKMDKHIKILEGEIAKSNTIIRDILDFTRNRALNATPQKIDELVENAIERIQFPQNVNVSKELTLGEARVMVDEDEIRQVLVNLMENACQAMTSGGNLSIGTKTHNDCVQIRISDTGCGIPKEHLQKIFAPFFTTKSRGTGLGLAVVKKIIERHHGVIEVESIIGEGTTFVIRLPLKGVSAVPVQASVQHRAGTGEDQGGKSAAA